MESIGAVASTLKCAGPDCPESLPFNANPRRMYCSQRCGQRAHESRKSVVKRSLPDYVIGTERTCAAPDCDRTFTIRIHNQVYCNKVCYRQAQSSMEIVESCTYCGCLIPEERRSRRVRYCGDECAVMGKRSNRKPSKRPRVVSGNLEITLGPCESCDQLIPKNHPEHRFCKSCRLIGRKARHLGVSAKDAFTVWMSESCQACGQAFDVSSKGNLAPVLDHDHVTGSVRGKIHSRCNLAIGMIDDNPEIAIMLALYLSKRGRAL